MTELKSASAWVLLGVSLSASITAIVAGSTTPPLLPLIIKDLSITYTEASFFQTLFNASGTVVILFGLASDIIGPRRLGALGIMSMVLGSLIVALSSTFGMALLGQLVEGIGSTAIGIVTLVVIPRWFPAKDLGKAMGVYATGLPIATVIAFNLLDQVGFAYGWRSTFYVNTVLEVVMLGIFVLVIRDGPLRRTGDTDNNALKAFTLNLRNKEAWKLGVFWLLSLGAWTAFSTWMPTILNESKGLSLAYASSLTSVPLGVSLVAMPLIGLFSDRVGKRKVFLFIGPALIVCAFLGISYTSGMTLILWFLVAGLGFSMVPPTVFSLNGELSRAGGGGSTFGILNECSSLGIVFPVLVGAVQDYTGGVTYSPFVISIIMGLSIVAAYFVRESTTTGSNTAGRSGP